MQHSISLSMIVKDEVESLDRCLASAAPYVQEIVIGWNGSNPETKAVMEKYGVKIVPFEWRDDFAWARNFVYDHCSNDLVMWLDADDELVGGENLKKHMENFAQHNFGALWFFYDYEQDAEGNCKLALWRERVLRKKFFKWVGVIHEENLPRVQCTQLKVKREDIYVLHHTTPERINDSAIRNLRIAHKAYASEHEPGGAVDPVNVWHYARSLDSAGYHNEAIPVFEEFIGCTETDEHRFQATTHLAEMYRKFRRPDKAAEYDMAALRMKPFWPDAYFGMAANAFLTERWEEVGHWTDLGLRMQHPGDNSMLPYDPIRVTIKPLEPFCFALVQMAKFEQALAVCKKALSIMPTHPFFISFAEKLPEMIEQQHLEKACLDLNEFLGRNGESHKLKSFARAIPDAIKDHPVFVRLRHRFEGPKDGSNRLVIYCGYTVEFWDPNSAKDGIGGSEEAVIYLSNYLAKLGWDVEVFNNCLAPGNYNGVEWKGIWEYDRTQPAAVFITWRNALEIFHAPDGAYNVLWLHDRQKPEYYNDEIVNKIDKIFVLSQYHRYDLPEIPDEKFFITGNGIVPGHFAQKMPRNPFRCVYASSPDRGLDIVLNLWPDIIKEVPEAELHIYYGFGKAYDEIHKNNKGMRDFKSQILNTVEKLPNVFWHGRIGHKELVKEFQQSALWLYPTCFTEISCITAMKCQAAGAIPVTVTLAALNETVQHGYKFPYRADDKRTQKAWTQRVINLLKNHKEQEDIRKEMMPWALEKFSWEKIANDWSDCFKANIRNRGSEGRDPVSADGVTVQAEAATRSATMEVGVAVEGEDPSGVQALDTEQQHEGAGPADRQASS